MEGSPDEEDARSTGPAGPGPRERPRAEPNGWILLGITALALALTVAVLVLSAI